MSDINLTGSESIRFSEIHDNWIVFEPLSSEENMENHIFSVPVGFQKLPVLTFDSGSCETTENGILIEKLIYKFEDENKAYDFITNIGEENLVSIDEKIIERLDGKRFYDIQVHLLNQEEISIEANFSNLEISKGFKLEIWTSGSIEQGGMRKIEQDYIIKDGSVVSDSYLEHFTIVTDKEENE